MQLSQNEKYFLNFFFLHFLNLDSILNNFKNKMTLAADIFFNLQTPKYVGRWVSKKARFKGPFDK